MKVIELVWGEQVLDGGGRLGNGWAELGATPAGLYGVDGVETQQGGGEEEGLLMARKVGGPEGEQGRDMGGKRSQHGWWRCNASWLRQRG